MEKTEDHPFVGIARELVQSLATEVRRSFLRLAATLIVLITGTVVLITAAMTAVVMGIIHLGRGLVMLSETMIGSSWGAELAVGAFLLLIPLLATACAFRRSSKAGNKSA